MTSSRKRRLALVTGLFLLLFVIFLSMAVGSKHIPLSTITQILSGQQVPESEWHVIAELRLPRTIVGITAGMALGVAGALIQSLTRNPLADPGILGVTAGSSFCVALSIVFLGLSSPTQYMWFALVGALIATTAVFLISGTTRSGANPAQLTLAGVAVTAVLAGIVSAMRLSSPKAFTSLQAWEVGSLVNRSWDVLAAIAPLIALGLILAFSIGGALNALALGNDVAATLGTSLWRTKIIGIIAITLLAGGATALAGPISFIGLMIPHVARWICGPDQRWIMGLTILFSPILILTADVAARLVVWPGEMPVGIVTAFIGAPMLIALVRRRKAFAL